MKMLTIPTKKTHPFPSMGWTSVLGLGWSEKTGVTSAAQYRSDARASEDKRRFCGEMSDGSLSSYVNQYVKFG